MAQISIVRFCDSSEASSQEQQSGGTDYLGCESRATYCLRLAPVIRLAAHLKRGGVSDVLVWLANVPICPFPKRVLEILSCLPGGTIV